MVGRGTRLCEGKTELLLLDFLWHTERHELCRPAHLICENPEVAEKMTKNLAEQAGCTVDIEQAEQTAAREYEGTIYYDRLILGKWVRAEGAIYRKFADSPNRYYCRVVDSIDPDLPYRQFLRSQLRDITIGIDFGGNRSGHAFTATAHTGDYRELIALRSERHLEECDPNDIDRIALDFAQAVLDSFGMPEHVYWDNAETVLGRGIKKAFEKRFPSTHVHGARKAAINDRIRCATRLMGADRFFYTDGCMTLKTALSEAVWNDKSKHDERLDDGSTDIDTLDSFDYTFERDMKRYIRAVQNGDH